jgi:hypothetical protein
VRLIVDCGGTLTDRERDILGKLKYLLVPELANCTGNGHNGHT